MSTRLVLVSDTHVPDRARRIPDALWRELEAADVVVHAGDWTAPAVLDELESRVHTLVGVCGNNDGPELRERLPTIATADLDGVRVAVVHETGPAAGREERCAARFLEADVLVFGHSHIPWDTTAPGGLRLLNPGSPTDRRRQPVCTLMRVVLDGGHVRDVELVDLGSGR